MCNKQPQLAMQNCCTTSSMKMLPILLCLNPLIPNRDENEISLYSLTACSNIQVMRMKETITKDKMS